MSKFIPVALASRTIQIQPRWAGQGIAIHKPLTLDPITREPYLQSATGVWCLTHINTGLSLGRCYGSFDRALAFARPWDAEFAALQRGQAMAPDRLRAWAEVVKAMRTAPPIRPRQPAIRRGWEAQP